ncbi:hypothetical protein [Mangrovibacillus cuniculi]|uniref:Uncharacterized protein n=1 Tax=Mangrovibacillus cuniculi TaxID=2593652 RepID=A0A7S8HGU9_9BACI|nr:hypothetical protein [Mangrovibacillus cuniculi]QPC48278.1 hypothetical protein G8O30_15805 [Mangrovibacillus cuniculi]
MFHFSSFIKTLGVVLLAYTGISFLLGFLSITNTALVLTVFYTACYIVGGILAPIWNKETPYSASYFVSISLTVLNFLVANFVLNIAVFSEPQDIHQALVRNSTISMLVTAIVIFIIKRQEATK